MGSWLGAKRSRAGCHTFRRKSRGVRESVRCRGWRSAPGPAAVSNLTNLSAGGLRNSTTVGAADRPKGARACGMGAHPGDGLATAEWQHARTNCRRPSAPVLGPEACRVFGTEGSCKPNSAAAETGLLHSKMVLLGRSDSVSSRHTLERWSDFFVLEWSCGEGHSAARRQTIRITLNRLAHLICHR